MKAKEYIFSLSHLFAYVSQCVILLFCECFFSFYILLCIISIEMVLVAFIRWNKNTIEGLKCKGKCFNRAFDVLETDCVHHWVCCVYVIACLRNLRVCLRVLKIKLTNTRACVMRAFTNETSVIWIWFYERLLWRELPLNSDTAIYWV